MVDGQSLRFPHIERKAVNQVKIIIAHDAVDIVVIKSFIGIAVNIYTTICMAIGLMTGLGSAAGFNLELGRKNEELAKKYGEDQSPSFVNGVLASVVKDNNIVE